MARRKKREPARPTEAELEILRVLWRLGSSTVREIHDGLTATDNADQREIGYTTVLKILQIMHDKAMVVRDDGNRAHIYAAAESREAIQGHTRAFAGRFTGGRF